MSNKSKLRHINILLPILYAVLFYEFRVVPSWTISIYHHSNMERKHVVCTNFKISNTKVVPWINAHIQDKLLYTVLI